MKILKMDMKNLFSNPAWLIMNTVFPLVLVLLLSHLVQPYYGDTVKAIDYFTMTILIFTASNSAVMAANTFLEERIKKPNLRVMYAPISKFSITFTKTIATFIYVGVCLMCLGLLLHFFFGANVGDYKVWILILCLCFISSSIGTLCACIFKSEETANMVASTFISAMAVLGGTFFSLPSFMRSLSKVSYLKWCNEVIFKLIYDGQSSNYIWLILGLIGGGLIVTLISNVVFKEEDYL